MTNKEIKGKPRCAACMAINRVFLFCFFFVDKIKHKSEQDIIVSQLFLIISSNRPW